MRSVVLVVPGQLHLRSGGYEYDRRIVEGLRGEGWWVDVRELGGGFPLPTAAEREQVSRIFRQLPTRSVVVVDGLALGALPEIAQREAARLRLVALVHHPLAHETGLDQALRRALGESERTALAAVKRVIVTSHRTAAALGEYGVPPEKVLIVEPGTDPAPLATGSKSPTVHLLCVAALIPRKGHDVLLRALGGVIDRNWRLICVGSDRDAVLARRLRSLANELGIEPLVQFAGEAGAASVAAHYDSADVFVLATLYEGYGMAVAEALARGLPIVSTTVGAIPEIVSDRAGILVPPGDVSALTSALSSVLGDASLRARLAEGARRASTRLPTWPMAAVKLAAALDQVAHG
jgi:glycosyltransferase involved in cell wall biosynthesis